MNLRTLFGTLLLLLPFSDTWTLALDLDLDARALSISDIPPCGLMCMFQAIPISGCSFDDMQCQCQSSALKQVYGQCMLTNCTMADSLDSAKVQADICNFSDESKRTDLILYTSIVFSIAILFVGLRIAGKILAGRTSTDDWIIVFAMLLSIIPCACVLRMARIGFGEHFWNLQPGRLQENLMYFYVAWSTYVIILGLIKVSLIMFYLQIFPSRRFRIVSYTILIAIVLNALVIFLLTVFTCNPISSFWNRDIKGAKCMDIQVLGYVNSGCAIVQDVIILVLPMFCLRKLNMKRFRKFAVCLMFSIGTLGCVATIIRLHTLLSFKISIDPTWDYVPVTVWTTLELGCGFVCVSLPSIRILLGIILPKNLLDMMSHRSRSDTPTPLQDMNSGNKNAKRGFSVFHIPTVSNGSSFWSSAAKSQSRGQHQRLGSRSDYYLETPEDAHVRSSSLDSPDLATTAPPFKQVYQTPSGHTSLNPPRNGRQFCSSCGTNGEYITALPRIGCLPKPNSSQLDITRRDFSSLDRQRDSSSSNNV